MLIELLNVSEGDKYIPGFSAEDLNDILVSICVS
jgi:hypothetical protein